MSCAESVVIEKLKRAQVRREKRMAHLRVVYSYSINGALTDNLLLLPMDTEKAHEEFLRTQLSHVFASMPANWSPDFYVVRIGIFDKSSSEFRKEKQKVILSVRELYDLYKKVNSNG